MDREDWDSVVIGVMTSCKFGVARKEGQRGVGNKPGKLVAVRTEIRSFLVLKPWCLHFAL